MATIPASPFDDWHEQLGRQRSRIRTLGELDPELFNRRPAEAKWSVGENLEHLSLSLGPYLTAIEKAAGEASADGRTGVGPWKRGWFVAWFIRSAEPPVKLKVRTFRTLVPAKTLDRDRVVEQLLRITGDFGGVIDSLRGLDLGRVKLRSPILPLLKVDVASAVDLNLAHDRRHLWTIDRILERDDFRG